MGLLRAFIAVEIPLAIREAACGAILPLQRALGSTVRWVPIENLHLTLKFLGAVSPSNLDMLSDMLRAEAGLFDFFELRLGGLGTFPSLKRPRVIYVGIQAPAALHALQRGIDSASHRLGYESEERSFSPHLTIGRVKQNVTASDQKMIRHALEETRIDSLGTARVDSVHLYKSDLQPGGSIYTRLYTAPLKTN